MHNRARHAHESTPLVRRDTDTDDAATRTRWVKYGVLVSLLGVLLVAGSARVAWETPKSADLGEYPLGFTSTMATASHVLVPLARTPPPFPTSTPPGWKRRRWSKFPTWSNR